MASVQVKPINSSELKQMMKCLINKPENILQRAKELQKESVLPFSSSDSIVKSSCLIEVCFSELHNCICSNKTTNNSIFLTSEIRKEVEDIIYILKNKTSDNLMQFQLCKFLNTIEIFSLELIWRLQRKGIITIEAFLIQALNQANILALFSRSLVNLCLLTDDDETEIKLSILTDILPSLVMCAFNKSIKEVEPNEEKNVQWVCQIMFESLLQKICSSESQIPSEKKW
ncbi:uncharacterized protein [Centruroides vittatus]|uniref:uncharacterized protein n=1 Tax=Centruroides vittatus TaxID=120091 RepID=UPI00350FCB66